MGGGVGLGCMCSKAHVSPHPHWVCPEACHSSSCVCMHTHLFSLSSFSGEWWWAAVATVQLMAEVEALDTSWDLSMDCLSFRGERPVGGVGCTCVM
jgi:hypothetical protein